MKALFFAIGIMAISFTINAQDSAYSGNNTFSDAGMRASSNNKIIWSIGVQPSLPIGHFNSYSSFGLGGSFQGECKTHSVGITLNVGYIDYFGKTADTITYSDFKYWPVLGGLKFYMSDNSYLHGQAGAGFGSKGLGTSFWYGAGVGFNLSKAIDAEVKYTGWKQGLITKNGNGGNGIYPGTGGTGGTGGSGGYGGHYSTIDLRLAYNF